MGSEDSKEISEKSEPQSPETTTVVARRKGGRNERERDFGDEDEGMKVEVSAVAAA